MSDDRTPDEETPETPAEETPAAAEESTPPVADAPSDEQPSAGAPDAPVAEQADAVEAEAAAEPEAEVAAEPEAEVAATTAADSDDDAEEATPREKPLIPGADLEVDIVTESSESRSAYSEDGDDEESSGDDAEDEADDQPIAAVEINLAADARYRATGKRKTAVARVTLRPGTGEYTINGRPLDAFFPRHTLQRTIRQPLETVGYEDRMDVVARMHGGGVSSQAGALRHGISRALLEADPNLRGELKRRGFLTRDARAKERKKAGLKKARKRPQFSKR
jgi:small subunit ribosomal protein S9